LRRNDLAALAAGWETVPMVAIRSRQWRFSDSVDEQLLNGFDDLRRLIHHLGGDFLQLSAINVHYIEPYLFGFGKELGVLCRLFMCRA
jgi:hypothetical protein